MPLTTRTHYVHAAGAQGGPQRLQALPLVLRVVAGIIDNHVVAARLVGPLNRRANHLHTGRARS